MLEILIGIFIVLHGLVHFLYVGQSQKIFQLRPELTWPEGSWAFSKLFGDEATRSLASIACGLAAVGFVAGGVGVLGGQAWGRSLVVGVAVFSAAAFILFWNGKTQKLDAQGGVSILINIVLIVVVLFSGIFL